MSGVPDGFLSDPPVPPAASRAMGQPLFAEFECGTLPEWALVRHNIDPAEIGDVRAAVRAALEPVIGTVAPGARACVAAGSRESTASTR